MTFLYIDEGLLLTKIRISYRGNTLELNRALVDTGSGTTIISADKADIIGISPEDDDKIYRIRGVGGWESVYSKKVNVFELGTLMSTDFTIEIGAMNYGFDIDAIVGLDFLHGVNAIIDLKNLRVSN